LADSDGVQVSADNAIHNLHLDVSPEKRVILNDTAVTGLGRIELHGVTTIGRARPRLIFLG